MNEVLEHLINHIEKVDLCLMFGDGSHVKVNDFKYSTNLKKYYVNVTLNATETDEFAYAIYYPVGLNMIVESVMVYLAINDVAISTNLLII